ncbi:unnamed protein product [Discosporangium mesarthrocarpum]
MPHETMTDMPHCVYPEGIYCALKARRMSRIGHPLYVTENGIADADDTRRRCAVYLLYSIAYLLYVMESNIADAVILPRGQGCTSRGTCMPCPKLSGTGAM